MNIDFCIRIEKQEKLLTVIPKKRLGGRNTAPVSYTHLQSLRPKLLSEEIEAVKKYLAHEYQIYTEVTSTRAGKN